MVLSDYSDEVLMVLLFFSEKQFAECQKIFVMSYPSLTTNKNTLWSGKWFLPIILLEIITVHSIPLSAQTALSQLENWAGARISSVNVPAPTAPGGGNYTYRLPFSKTPEQKSAEAADHYADALKAMRNRNWDDAVRLLKKAVRKSPYSSAYSDKLKEAEAALEKERQQNRELQEKIRQQEEAKKKAEEDKRLAEEARLEKIRQEQAVIKAKLEKAENTILAFRKDIKEAQLQLKNYSKALLNNNSELEKWGQQVDQSYNSVLENSKEYLAGLFIKYNLMGALKKQLHADVYKKMGNLWKSSNPEIQKWLAKNLAEADLKADKVEEVVDFVSKGGDLAELLTADKEEAGYNLKVLLFLNGVMESSGLSGYEKLMENALGAMPGDYFEQAKMIGETYADLAAICYSWFSIRKINASNEEMAQKVKILSAGIEQRMEEIECLKKCMKNYTSRCLESCTGKTRWSTPPPPLLFNYRKW